MAIMRSGLRAGATRSSRDNPALRPGPQAPRADLNITTIMFPRARRLRSREARRSASNTRRARTRVAGTRCAPCEDDSKNTLRRRHRAHHRDVAPCATRVARAALGNRWACPPRVAAAGAITMLAQSRRSALPTLLPFHSARRAAPCTARPAWAPGPQAGLECADNHFLRASSASRRR